MRPARTGVWLFQSARNQVVDGYTTTAYELSGITLEAKVRYCMRAVVTMDKCSP